MCAIWDRTVGLSWCNCKEELQKTQHASNVRLYTNRKDGERRLRSFRDVYKETKARLACYLTITKLDGWEECGKNECKKEQTSLKKEVDEMLNEYEREVNLGIGLIEMNGERMENWKRV